ncbi:hypothetical protein [Actinoplanes sp. NPDC020271]|uniref:hypothetical protein n=1 Tax=Actinoplanes sp. NPDC020271 TaxID=3363896 RepID=UPI00378A6956
MSEIPVSATRAAGAIRLALSRLRRRLREVAALGGDTVTVDGATPSGSSRDRIRPRG